MSPFRTLCAALCSLAFFPAFAADTVDWTGESGGSYTEAANWTVRGTGEHRIPTYNDIIVFNPGAGTTLSIDCSGVHTQGGGDRATIAITGDETVVWPEGLTLDVPANFNLEIAPGAILDLGGQTLTVRRAVEGARARVTNGTLVETNPAKGMMMLR